MTAPTTPASAIHPVLREAEAIASLLAEGMAMARQAVRDAEGFKQLVGIVFHLAADDQPVPLPALIADVASSLLTGESRLPPGSDRPEIRAYDDFVLAKLGMDRLLERAGEAIQNLPIDDRPRGIAYLLKEIRGRLDLPAVELSPGVVRGLLDRSAEELAAWAGELSPLTLSLLRGTAAAFRNAADVLVLEDVLALEQRTALLPFGQYLAHRQILQTSKWFRVQARIPTRRATRRRQVATRLRDEDQYPIGGYSSISNRGALESLLHSQLAYMEPTGADRPDLFDLKYLRDELFYYARDENDFHRQRRSFRIAFHPSLFAARRKDAELPVQRIILALGLVDAMIQELREKLATEALTFSIAFLPVDGQPELNHERELVSLAQRDAIQRGELVLERPGVTEWTDGLRKARESGACEALLIGYGQPAREDASVLDLAHAVPALHPAHAGHEASLADAWLGVYQALLVEWLG